MTAWKKCLLGTVAGFVATTGADAAGLPAKAPKEQYVKICTLYGDGFYYIPGTDTCIKVGGYVRADLGWNVTGARTANYAGAGGSNDRTSLDLSTRGRANFGMDTRTPTQFGVVRAVGSVHFQNQDAVESMNTSRAFVQWAGWTFGRIKSFQDTFALNESWNLAQGQTNSDTGANGVQSVAYTFDIGNGVTFDLGADDRRTKQIANLSVASTLKLGADPTDTHQTQTYPDLYGALHIDEPEGFFALSAGVHNVNAGYYAGNGSGPFAAFKCAQGGTTLCGHPADKVGYFVQVGGEYKLPGAGGDRIGAGFRYAVGASQFGAGSTLASPDLFDGGNNVAVGWTSDGVFVNGSGIELTTTWSAQGGYEHRWLPNLSTDVFAGFSHYGYNAQAKSYFAGALCGAANTGAVAQTAFTVAGFTNSCNPDWSFLELGSKTTWRPIPGLAISGEIMYNQVYTAFAGTGNLISNAPGARPTGVYAIGDHNIWTAFFRVQRNYAAAGAGSE